MVMQTAEAYYKPVCRPLVIGNREYAVLDQDLAATRAQVYLEEAQVLIDKSADLISDEALSSKQRANRALTVAIDFGSQDAPFILARRILRGEAGDDYCEEDAIIFYKLAAERGNAKACYIMACCYAGMNDHPEVIHAGKHYFGGIEDQDRQLLADYYFGQAKQLDYCDTLEN